MTFCPTRIRARISLVALGVHPHPHVMLALGAGVFVLGATLLWYGREPARAVLPGFAAGFLPLCLALCTRHLGHLCSDAECVEMCLPVCVAGGVLAAGVVSWYGTLRARRTRFWASASGVALLTGAVGASCAGYRGVLAVALGYAFGFTGAFVLMRLCRARRTTDGPR